MAASPVVQEKSPPSTSFLFRIRRPKSSVARPGAAAEHLVPSKLGGFLSTNFISSRFNITMTSNPASISNTSLENSLGSESDPTNTFPASNVALSNEPRVKPRPQSTPIFGTPSVVDSTLSHASQPKITMSNFTTSTEITDDTSYRRIIMEPAAEITHGISRSQSTSQSSLSWRLWNSPSVSRSPSPSSKDERSSRDEDDSTTASSISSTCTTNPNRSGSIDGSIGSENRQGNDKSSRSNKLTRKFTKLKKNSSSDPQSVKSISTDRLSVNVKSTNTKRVKDELWEAYKILENDYQKFYSKSAAQKTTVIRQALLPFLRKYNGRSSATIPPEELEKRTRTLHRWWTGLIAQLKNRNTPAMLGCDRPVYLEAISYIMSRPEWRTAPSTYAPLAGRLSASNPGSSTSLSSDSSKFSLQKSVQHNIKALFTRTLFDTLAYTVERLGFRTAPPSLVALGGKTIAYAFFFCQGVAETLIDIWGLQPATVRRVFSEFEISRGTDLRDISETVVCEFPEPLHSFGLTSDIAFVRQMKQPKIKKPPVGIQINWEGPWTFRWCGRDSDLLFVFFKHYHILMCDYLSPDATPTARLCAPGYVHVLAQMLSLVDNTIHRNLSAPEHAASTATFDDLLNATAAIPIPVRGAARGMSENKLVVLLRDVLFESNCLRQCRVLFAGSFIVMLKAAVKKTRLYDADACFQLCDLVEELLPILTRAVKEGIGDLIDWDFWLDAAQTMLQSENNMTELRVLTFVYTTWPILVEDENRKGTVCLKWLLSTPVWDRFFCHWCPMVRAYYMRLICWRLGRYDGSTSMLDVNIHKSILIRLRTGYAYHMKLKEDFEKFGRKPSSTAPCLPAPSRRLVILRNDTVAPSRAVRLNGTLPELLSFDASPGSLLRSHSTNSLASLPETDIQTQRPPSPCSSEETTTSTTNRRWSTLRSVFGFKPASTCGDQNSPPSTPPGLLSDDGSAPEDGVEPQVTTSFKFSLEWIDRPMFGRERILDIPRLASTTQNHLESFLDEELTIDKVTDESISAKHWTYIGRALAEWVLVVVEYENFFDRRKSEGKEVDKEVETPSLCIESMRKF